MTNIWKVVPLLFLWPLGCGQTLPRSELRGLGGPKEVGEPEGRPPDAGNEGAQWSLPACPERPEGALTDPVPTSRPELGREDIRRGVRRYINRFRFCLERERRCNLGGRWLVRFIVSPDGAVTHAGVVEFTSYDQEATTSPAIEACLAEAFCGLSFARPPGGRRAFVTYPVHFDGVCN